MQQKIKIQIFPKFFEVLAKKPLLKFEFYPVHISVTIHFRNAGVFCSVSEDIPIVQRLGYFFKMSNFGSFGALFCNFDFQNCLVFRCRHLKRFGQLTYLLKLCNKKSKFKFSQKFWSFGQKTLLKFEFCPVHISVAIHCRIAGVFCSVSGRHPHCATSELFFQNNRFWSFFGNFCNFGFKNCLFSYIIAHAKFHSFDHQL